MSFKFEFGDMYSRLSRSDTARVPRLFRALIVKTHIQYKKDPGTGPPIPRSINCY